MQVYKPNNKSTTTTSKVVWETSNSDFCILYRSSCRGCYRATEARRTTHRYGSYSNYLTTMLPRLIRAKARKQYRVCVHLFAANIIVKCMCVLYCLLRAIMPMVREKKWQKLKADLT